MTISVELRRYLATLKAITPAIPGNPMASTNIVLDAVMQEIEQTPPEYLPNLLQIVRLFRESVTLTSAEAKGEATNNSFEPIPSQGEAISQTLLNERR